LRASGDRWLFGYADVVTLLFACFAALYATQANPVPAVEAAAAATPAAAGAAAPSAPAPAPASAPVRPGTPIADEIAALLTGENQVHIDLTNSETATVISLAEAGSFAVGKADLTAAAERVIGKLADLLRSRAVSIRVEGHTDDRPIRTSKYESNWELSTARASRVVVFLVEQGGFSPDRLSAAGYGEFRPKVPNLTNEDRARNRRVDIVVIGGAGPGGVQDGPMPADYGSVGIRPSDRR
jgi:chemotaxis protein MotB